MFKNNVKKFCGLFILLSLMIFVFSSCQPKVENEPEPPPPPPPPTVHLSYCGNYLNTIIFPDASYDASISVDTITNMSFINIFYFNYIYQGSFFYDNGYYSPPSNMIPGQYPVLVIPFVLLKGNTKKVEVIENGLEYYLKWNGSVEAYYNGQLFDTTNMEIEITLAQVYQGTQNGISFYYYTARSDNAPDIAYYKNE